MRLNYETIIIGEKCILVPYRYEHVKQYHIWMQDPTLLYVTGSEPLSIQEEYDMQQSWRDDNNKCTFIILARDLVNDKIINESLTATKTEDVEDTTTTTTNKETSFINQTLDAMVGDVNLFLSDEEEVEDDDDHETEQKEKEQSVSMTTTKQAEIDIMVAEEDYRGKGIGREACILMMLFATERLSIRRFFCKIKENNIESIKLFKERLGFIQCSYAKCFNEIEYELKKDTVNEMIDTLVSLLLISKDVYPLRIFYSKSNDEI